MSAAIPILGLGEILAGTEYTCVVTVTSGGAAVDIGAWAIKLQIDASTPITLEVGSGITILDDGDNGQFRITLVETDTEGIALQSVAHECQYNAGGEDKALFRGKTTIVDALIAEVEGS